MKCERRERIGGRECSGEAKNDVGEETIEVRTEREREREA
jgi:hypothetical protein